MNPRKMLEKLNESESKESYKQWQENNKLSLRKNHIFNTLLSKRKFFSEQAEIKSNKYYININEVSTNEEIKNNPELYIKTKFDIKNWFKFLFSSNLNQVKESLFIIQFYIFMQIEKIPLEKRALSRNDTELINGLCDYLLHPDKQISFNACACLINLTFFPIHIESRIITERNMAKMIEAFNSNDFEIGQYLINLFINCSLYTKQSKYFIEHGILKRLLFLINNDLNKLVPKNYFNIIKLLCHISRLFKETDLYNRQQILNWYSPFLPFVKQTFTKSFVQSPWANYEHIPTYLEIIQFYVRIALKDKELIEEIIQGKFSSILIEFYYKLNNDKDKIQLIKIFVDLLSVDDSINQTFIEDEIILLFMNEINRIEYKNLELLNYILICCSNISCGTVGQIFELYQIGIIWKCFEIINKLKEGNLTISVKRIIYNSIYTLTEAILGIEPKTKALIMLHRNYEIISILSYGLKNIIDTYNEEMLLKNIGNAINELIICAQSYLDTESEIEFKNKFFKNGMEEIINNIIICDEYNKELENSFNQILEYLKE